MSQELGSFTPYQYSGNKKDGKGQRMAGDYLNDFAKSDSNVMKVLGGESYNSNSSSSSNSNANSLENRNTNSNVSANVNSGSNNIASQEIRPADSAPKSQSGWTDASGKVYKANKETPEAAAARAAQQEQAKNKLTNRAAELTASYEPGKYQYYESEFGSGTGADAYGKDMANYESWVEMNNSGFAAGHLGLVSQMMHPDWGASQKTGGGNPIIEQDHSKPRLSGRQQNAKDMAALKAGIKPFK